MKRSISILSIFLCYVSYAQAIKSPLERARDLASKRDYEVAISVIEQALEYLPTSHDLLAYNARLYLWMGEFERAEDIIDSLFELYPNDHEAYQLQITRHWWTEQWRDLLSSTNEGLKYYPNDKMFIEKKMLALKELKRYKEAIQLYESSREPVLHDLSDEVKLLHHQQLGMEVSYSEFSNTFEPWMMTTLRYRRLSKNSYNVSVTYGELFDHVGMSVNAEYYAHLGNKTSAYIEAGGSPSDEFPTYRIGVEATHSLSFMEVSAGAKVLKFKDQQEPILLTVGIGKYVKQFYVNYKLYQTNLDESSTLTHTMLIRKLFSNRFHFLQLNLTNGTVPLQISNITEVTRVAAHSIQVSYSQLLFSKLIAHTSVAYHGENYPSGIRRSRYQGQVGFSWML